MIIVLIIKIMEILNCITSKNLLEKFLCLTSPDRPFIASIGSNRVMKNAGYKPERTPVVKNTSINTKRVSGWNHEETERCLLVRSFSNGNAKLVSNIASRSANILIKIVSPRN